MVGVVLEGWLFKKNPEFEKYCRQAAEACARAYVERQVSEQKGYRVYTESEIEMLVQQYTEIVYKDLVKQLKDPDTRAYYKGLYPKDFEKQLRAERWNAKEISYFLEFLTYTKKAVAAYENKSKWQ